MIASQKRLALAQVMLILLVAAPQLPAQAATTYDVVMAETNLMIPTRDGTQLATDIYRPARNGVAVNQRFPILLNRTPYNKTGLRRAAEYFVQHGYVVVVQDIRGRYKSQGVYSKLQPEGAPDAFDVMQYLAKLPYGNGQIGTWGTSYSAHTQAGAAIMNPPAMKTAVLNQGGMPNAWDHGVRYRGTYEMGRQLTWAWSQMRADAKSPEVRKLLETEKVEDWYAAQPLRRGLNPLSAEPNFERWYMYWYEHADYDDYWKNPMLNWEEHYAQTADIPMMHVGGWYDIFLAGTFKNFVELGKLKKAPQYVMVGPWTHSGNSRAYAGDVSFGEAAAILDFGNAWHLRWFDHHLKGQASGAEKYAPVRLFVMGTGDGHKDQDGRLFHGGYWRDSQVWPLTGTQFVPYYFQADGTLSPSRPTSPSSSTTYTYDPTNPVPTIGGGSSARLKDGAYNQREDPRFPPSKAPFLPLKSRADVVVFQTEPLAQDMTVIGPIVVKLYASTSALDTDFTAKLVDVYPPSLDFPTGFEMNITDAIIRGRYRATRDHQVLLKPDSVYEFTIEPFPTANVFKKGHRVRVDISSSNFPRFDANPNTGEPLGKNRQTIKADNTVHHSAAYPSHIILPLAPARP